MFEAFPNIKTKYPLQIACVDIETLDLEESAVVVEVGLNLATFVLDEKGDLVVSSSETTVYSFNVLEQISLGRTMSKETFDFHISFAGYDNTANMVAAGLSTSADVTRAHLTSIQSKTAGVAEVWINGLSFDPSIIRSLAKSYGYTTTLGMNSLWHHHKERDVRTIYRTFPLPGRENKKSSHRAAEDAEWDMEMAKIYHQGVISYDRWHMLYGPSAPKYSVV